MLIFLGVKNTRLTKINKKYPCHPRFCILVMGTYYDKWIINIKCTRDSVKYYKNIKTKERIESNGGGGDFR